MSSTNGTSPHDLVEKIISRKEQANLSDVLELEAVCAKQSFESTYTSVISIWNHIIKFDTSVVPDIQSAPQKQDVSSLKTTSVSKDLKLLADLKHILVRILYAKNIGAGREVATNEKFGFQQVRMVMSVASHWIDSKEAQKAFDVLNLAESTLQHMKIQDAKILGKPQSRDLLIRFFTFRSRAALMCSKYREALECFRRAKLEHPHEKTQAAVLFSASKNNALAMLQVGAYGEAITWFNEALQLCDVSEPSTHRLQGYLLRLRAYAETKATLFEAAISSLESSELLESTAAGAMQLFLARRLKANDGDDTEVIASFQHVLDCSHVSSSDVIRLLDSSLEEPMLSHNALVSGIQRLRERFRSGIQTTDVDLCCFRVLDKLKNTMLTDALIDETVESVSKSSRPWDHLEAYFTHFWAKGVAGMQNSEFDTAYSYFLNASRFLISGVADLKVRDSVECNLAWCCLHVGKYDEGIRRANVVIEHPEKFHHLRALYVRFCCEMKLQNEERAQNTIQLLGQATKANEDDEDNLKEALLCTAVKDSFDFQSRSLAEAALEQYCHQQSEHADTRALRCLLQLKSTTSGLRDKQSITKMAALLNLALQRLRISFQSIMSAKDTGKQVLLKELEWFGGFSWNNALVLCDMGETALAAQFFECTLDLDQLDQTEITWSRRKTCNLMVAAAKTTLLLEKGNRSDVLFTSLSKEILKYVAACRDACVQMGCTVDTCTERLLIQFEFTSMAFLGNEQETRSLLTKCKTGTSNLSTQEFVAMGDAAANFQCSSIALEAYKESQGLLVEDVTDLQPEFVSALVRRLVDTAMEVEEYETCLKTVQNIVSNKFGDSAKLCTSEIRWIVVSMWNKGLEVYASIKRRELGMRLCTASLNLAVVLQEDDALRDKITTSYTELKGVDSADWTA